MLNMKKIILLFVLIISTCAVFAQANKYRVKTIHYAEIDTVLILNGTNFQVDTVTLASGQLLQYDGSKFTNVSAAPGVDSLTNVGDGYIRIYYAGNVVDSAYFEQNVVSHDETLVGLGTPDSLLRVDTSTLALKTWVTNLVIASNGYDDESAQDAVGTILDDGTVGDIVFTYDDPTPLISGEVEDDSHNHIIANIDNLGDSLLAKQNVVTGAASTITDNNLTANRALVSDASGKVSASTTISATELGYLDNASSNIQNQIDNMADNQTASEVPITDAGAYFTGTDVEAALQELASDIATGGDGWGADTVVHDETLIGQGTAASELYVNKTGDWTGTLDGYEATQLLDNTDNQTASEVVVADLGNNYTSTSVEGVLSEIALMLGGTGCVDTVQTLTDGTDTLDVSYGIHGILDIGANDTIRIEPSKTCNTGNITVICDAAGYELTFVADSTVYVSPYLEAVTKTITTTASDGAIDIYSWYFDGHQIFINGTKNYE